MLFYYMFLSESYSKDVSFLTKALLYVAIDVIMSHSVSSLMHLVIFDYIYICLLTSNLKNKKCFPKAAKIISHQ